MGYRHFESTEEYPSETSMRIKRLREVNNETQQELATAIGVNKFTIANVEQGKSALPLETAKNIALHYGVSVDYICGLSEDMAIPSTSLDALCRYVSLDILPMRMGETLTHEIPIIVIRKCLFDYLNVLVKAEQLEKKGVPGEVVDAWREKEGEKAKDLLRCKDNAETVKYALLSSRYISSDDVLELLEKAYDESLGDDGPL